MLPERSLDSFAGQIYHVRYPRVARSCSARLQTHYFRCVLRILIIIPLLESSSLTYNLEHGLPRYLTLLRRRLILPHIPSISYHGTPFDVYGRLHRIDV